MPIEVLAASNYHVSHEIKRTVRNNLLQPAVDKNIVQITQ